MSRSDAWIIDPAGELRPGFYRKRLIKDGPLVPVHLLAIEERDPATNELVADVEYQLWIDGEIVLNFLPRYPAGLFGEEITEAEYDFMRATTRHAVAHEPDHPAANPNAPIDLMTAPPPQF